jgi:hypothetical protein
VDRVVGQRVERATARLSRPVAAMIGVLAVWAALGVGHLVAGLLSAASSPFLAVGDAVVRLSPQSVTEFAKNTFGTSDKLVLLSAMFVVITLVGALAGLLSRERPNTGAWLIAALGGLGALAVYSSPMFADLDLVAPAAAMVNILGERDAPVGAVPRGLPAALAVPGAHVHLYGKRRSRRGRKMGHVTALGPDVATAEATATRAAELIRL